MKVYHVANPTISGELFIDGLKSDGYVPVLFEQRVSFSERQDRLEKAWLCNINLLYTSPVEAFLNNNKIKSLVK